MMKYGAWTLHPKVTASLLAGALTTIVVYSLHQWAHVDLPAEVSAALTALFAFVAGWLAPVAVTSDDTAEVVR